MVSLKALKVNFVKEISKDTGKNKNTLDLTESENITNRFRIVKSHDNDLNFNQ